MRTRSKIMILATIVALAATIVLACPTSVPCPIHDYSAGYFTGTKVIDGVLMGIYHCPRGHDFLARCN